MATLRLPFPSPCCCAHVNLVADGASKKELRFCSQCFEKLPNLYSGARVLSSLPPCRRIRRPEGGSAVVHRRVRWRLHANAADLRGLVESNINGSRNSSVVYSAPTVVPSVEIPVTCYQVAYLLKEMKGEGQGCYIRYFVDVRTLAIPKKMQILVVSDQAEKDEIVKSAMQLRNAQIEEGYTADVIVSRQNLLMDVRDKLLFEPEYAGNIKEKIHPKSSLRIPWTWFPAALCLLQEAGEDKIVLDIGLRALQHPDAKAYIHNVLLSMALAECAIAKVGFEKNKISQGFEALARAQCLLRSKTSLGKTTLLSQIEESLEELAPACTLELLGLPHTPDNAERRIGAISALRELLRQGLDIETSCRVQDWPFFLNQALSKLTAAEIVELLPWDDLALVRKNKKSLESHNQRVVIDFSCFYMVLIAHIALGFTSMQKDLIHNAQNICECLLSSEGIDLKFEESFCLFLLGQGDEATASERLRQLELNSKPAPCSSITEKEAKDVSNASKSLESWLKDSVLTIFPDTRGCSPSLVNFFAGEKRSSGNRQAKRSLQSISTVSQRSLTPPLALDRKAFEDTVTCMDSMRHLGPAVKQLTPPNLQVPPPEGKAIGGANADAPIQLKRNLFSCQNEVCEIWLDPNNIVKKIVCFTIFGFIVYASFRLMNQQFCKIGNAFAWRLNKPTGSSSTSWSIDFSLDQGIRPCSIKESRIGKKLKKLLPMFDIQTRHKPQIGSSQKFYLGASSFATGAYKQPMLVEEAEILVKKWQDIKAEALGPNYQVQRLFDILDEAMLGQWQALADAAKANSCFWKFVLLQLSVLRADILIDDAGKEMAEIEAVLEEAAELVDDSQPKNPNYYSTYKIRYYLKRQDDGSWRFCEGDIQDS